MKKFLLPICGFLFVFLCGAFITQHAFSDELDDVTKQINDLQSQLSQSVSATKPLESQLTSMQKQIADIKSRVAVIDQDVIAKKKSIDAQYQDLAKKQQILNATIRDFYIKDSYNSPLLTLLSTGTATELTQQLAYQKAARDEDKNIITNIALSISDLERKKQELETEATRLVSVKASLDKQSAELDKVVAGAKAYQANLSGKIANLSAKQQALIASKQASLNLPQSAYTSAPACSSDLSNGKDPGFSPRFGLFTYGVTHRVGLNQYGAKGRAEAGQNVQTILQAYFQNISFSNVSTSTNIHVVGTNEYGQNFDTTWDIETYVAHLYEMPTAWPAEALKAQAIAARSYALATTNNGASSICPSQSCQVVKQEVNSQAWIDAVHATAGQVMTSNGQPIKAWFSSTAGGYIHSSSDVGWSDTPYTKTALDASGPVSSFADLQSNAYDKSSPWFYCDWGARSQYGGTAWLKADELADIVNVIMLAKADSSAIPHLSQQDKSNPDGTDTWDSARVKQELKSRNLTPFNTINGATVDWDKGSGKVTTVSIAGDSGSQSFDGATFKSFFNVRAPANIQIVGPLYNIEMK